MRLGLYDNETSELCHWHIPETQYLEAWGDTRAYDGTVTIQQPLIAPLYRGKSAYEILALFSTEPERSTYDIVKGYWQEQHKTADFEAWWRKSVHDGLIANSSAAPKTISLKQLPPVAAPVPGLEVVIRPDPAVDDGRFSNNAWLQELPKPLSKLTWDNAALMGPALAQKLQVENTAEIEISADGRKVTAPVWIVPGHAPDSVTIHLGYGRKRAGRVAAGAGFNAYRLRGSTSLSIATAASIRRTGSAYPLSTTQDHWRMEGLHPRPGPGRAYEFRADPDFAQKMEELPPKELTLYPDFKYEGYAWGMAIDLTACTGCSACVVACQAENNIPVVGKDQVSRGREMHWIRIDRYFEGDDLDHPAPSISPSSASRARTRHALRAGLSKSLLHQPFERRV